MQMPTIETYGNYSSGNYGAHALCVTVGSLDVYFSYKTPVAFRWNGVLTIRQNDWSTTTGKHLNAIDPDKKRRVTGEVFQAKFAEAMKAAGLVAA